MFSLLSKQAHFNILLAAGKSVSEWIGLAQQQLESSSFKIRSHHIYKWPRNDSLYSDGSLQELASSFNCGFALFYCYLSNFAFSIFALCYNLYKTFSLSLSKYFLSDIKLVLQREPLFKFIRYLTENMDVNEDPPSEESNPEMVQVDVEEGMGTVESTV